MGQDTEREIQQILNSARCDWKPYYNNVGVKNPDNEIEWSDWTEAQLYENWVKRVMRSINPFEQSYKNFHEIGVATYVDMIQQAGRPYAGPVALNNDPDYLDSIGLIEFYETLLETAKNLSIDTSTVGDESGANNAILFATSRVSDLYMLLGNEAYADACDPTIGFATDNGGTAKPLPSFVFKTRLRHCFRKSWNCCAVAT